MSTLTTIAIFIIVAAIIFSLTKWILFVFFNIEVIIWTKLEYKFYKYLMKKTKRKQYRMSLISNFESLEPKEEICGTLYYDIDYFTGEVIDESKEQESSR